MVKKTLTPAEIKSQIKDILKQASSKISALANSHGYTICIDSLWNTYGARTLEESTPDQWLSHVQSEYFFSGSDWKDLSRASSALEWNELSLLTDKTIAKAKADFSKTRTKYLEDQKARKTKAKEDRQAKIARLRRQLAKLEAQD